MPARLTILLVAAVAALLAACGGGGRSGGKSPVAPPTAAARTPIVTAPAGAPAETRPLGTPVPATTATGVNAFLDAPCGLLSDDDIAPLGKAAGPGVIVGKPGANNAVTPVVITRDGIATSRCRWDMPGSSYLEAELYLLSDYASPQDYAKQSLARWADVGKAASQPVAGVGDFAGLVIPSQRDTQTVAIFLAQKGTVAISVYFSGPTDAAWPTAPQLQTLGVAAAARIF